MAKKKSGINPFYVLLAPLGVGFTLTACAYGVMAFKAVRGAEPRVAEQQLAEQQLAEQQVAEQQVAEQRSGAALLAYMDQHGAELMGVELALLAACTFGAIGADRYWMRSSDAEGESPEPKPNE